MSEANEKRIAGSHAAAGSADPDVCCERCSQDITLNVISPERDDGTIGLMVLCNRCFDRLIHHCTDCGGPLIGRRRRCQECRT